MRFQNKVVVVTGGSKGIGAGIARAFGAEGARVVVNYTRGKEDAERVVADIVARDGKAIAVQADVSRGDEVARLFAETRRQFGRLDVLVNNAGVFAFAPLEEITEDEFHRQFDVNVLGTLLATREALKLFGAEGGSVINVSSVGSENPPPGSSVYTATKGAIDTLTRTLARELAPKKIRVNAISPGVTITEGVRAQGLTDSPFLQRYVADTPLGRTGTPEDMAGVALFLASPDSAWVTGEKIVTSGGLR